MGRIFTIGYENLTPASLETLVTRLRVTLIDVRSRPYGRVKRGFAKKDLEVLLGDNYEWWGKELGGMGAGVTAAGLDRLGADKRDLMLMCQEHSPASCHRHHMIGVPLADRYRVVEHICEQDVVTATELARAMRDGDEYTCEDLAELLDDRN
ncbi:MAG: hypothetical protein C0467_27930 [Planctomycetaceae bacterium]|nr:hypothetical protein [Planctomycetaceae bacterium]